MLHRFDLHTHTFFSSDACNSPEEMIEAARRRGLSGIAITDHNTCEAHNYMQGRQLPEGFLVIPGVEVSTAEGHLLCIGATLPYLKGKPAREVLAEIKKAGGIGIPAHPFDKWRAGIRAETLDTLDLEALEVFNAAVTAKSYNEKALQYAKSRGLSWTSFELDELSVPALLVALRKGGQPEGHYLTFREGMKKNFANWFRLFMKKRRS
ncbi:MAG: PHP domain-containing protein [Proteobacteria bacterium]|nr:PHP domain-containing protein [Pseudomonadota bacterium]